MGKLILVFASFIFSACVNSSTKEGASAGSSAASIPEERSNLTRTEAQARSALIGDVSYKLAVTIDGSADYHGTQEIVFDLKKTTEQDLRLDFRGEVLGLSI